MWSYETHPISKGMEWIVAKGIEAMEQEHAAKIKRLQTLALKLGGALTSADALLQKHPSGAKDPRPGSLLTETREALDLYRDERRAS